MLSVVVHTEEEFDWKAPLDRAATGVTHMRQIGRAQKIFEALGIVPTYVIDYPIADQEEGYRPLREFADSGRALIGAHLHPWVSPPHTEEVCGHNSFPGNLPRDLEREKIALLTERIAATFGRRPTVYLAGRYGFGPNTAEILEGLEYEVDLSPCLPLDFTAEGGPDFSSYTNHPYWFGEKRRLLGIVRNGDLLGWLPLGKRFTDDLGRKPQLAWARLPGILSRLRAVERIGLSPEGYAAADLRRLARSLVRRGFRVFLFSFHSPSVQPGLTPYVRDEKGLDEFLGTCRDFFSFFLGELGGVAMTPLQIKDILEQTGRPASGNGSA
jgi:hypothetical protein